MTRRRGGEGGFTLVELLVVVVILGILSAVVVFAVHGAGDKGQGAALATDERTIRVAEEAHCAQKGSYVPIGTAEQPDTLVGDKFLSEPSKYHTVAGVPVSCGNGQHFDIKCAVSGQQMPDCGLTGGGGSPPGGGATCPLDTFCDVGTVPGGPSYKGADVNGAMLSLPSGKVLAFTRDVLSVYDPAVGDKGAWSTVDYPAGPPPYAPGGVPPAACTYDCEYYSVRFDGTAAVIRSRPGFSDCAPNCGKVMAHLVGASWYLFNPDDNSWASPGESQLDPTKGDPQNAKAEYADQILGTNCGNYCGQFLMVYDRALGLSGTGPNAELWDPKTGKFSIVTTPIGPHTDPGWVTALPDGRVMVTSKYSKTSGSYSPPEPGWTRFFNPMTYKDAVNNPGPGSPGSGVEVGPDHAAAGGPPQKLANGDVLFVDYAGGRGGRGGGPPAAVFQVSTDTWKVVPSCSSTTGVGCLVLTPIAGGAEVLAVEINGALRDWSGQAIGAWRFDPLGDGGVGKWTKTEGIPAASTRWGAVIEGPAGTPHVGQVVTAGLGSLPDTPPPTAASQLYKGP